MKRTTRVEIDLCLKVARSHVFNLRLRKGRVNMATGGKEDVDKGLTSGHDVVFDWTCGQF